MESTHNLKNKIGNTTGVIWSVNFIDGILNVQTCGLDMSGNNKNIKIVKDIQNVLVVFLYERHRAIAFWGYEFPCLKKWAFLCKEMNSPLCITVV